MLKEMYNENVFEHMVHIFRQNDKEVYKGVQYIQRNIYKKNVLRSAKRLQINVQRKCAHIIRVI